MEQFGAWFMKLIISWPPYANDSNITREAAEFYECLEDFFYSARRGTYKKRCDYRPGN